MADLAKLVVDLKGHVIDTIRDVKLLDINQKINDLEIHNFQSLLRDVGINLETFQTLFDTVQNISDPQTELAKLYKKQCLHGRESLEKTLQVIVETNNGPFTQMFPTVLKDLLAKFDKQLEALKGDLEKLAESIMSLYEIKKEAIEQSAGDVDEYKFVDMVPANPGNIVLNFDENSGTPESDLKKAIFDVNSVGTVTAVASGMGGVGKTCALRGVGRLPDAPRRFPDGIFHMSLGAEAGKPDLIRNIAEFVRRSGGYRKSKEVGVAINLSECVNLAAEWFRGRVCLFLIDDVWCQKGLDSTVTEVLSGLSNEPKSRIAFTTRDVTLRSTVKIRFNRRGQTDSEKILLCSAGLSSAPEEPGEISAMENVLNMTYGLPIALNVVGSRARYMVEENGVDANHLWSTFLETDPVADSILSGATFHSDQEKKVFNILLSSLQMIDSDTADGKSRHLFTELSILRKRQQATFDVVQRIWELSEKETRHQIEVLRRVSIIELSVVHFRGTKKQCIGLHDLFIDLARQLAEAKPNCMKHTAKRVLMSYVADNNESIEEESSTSAAVEDSTSKRKKVKKLMSKAKRVFKGKKPPFQDSGDGNTSVSTKIMIQESKFHESWLHLDDDGYALRNLFRLLHIAGMDGEGIALLSDPRWIDKQMKACGWKQVDTEFTEAITHLEEKSPTEGCSGTASSSLYSADGDVQTFLRMLRAAVSGSERHVVRSREPGMLSSQLYGRLINYKEYSLVDDFLQKVEATATGVWIKSRYAFPAPVASSGKVLDIGDVRLVRYGESSVEIVDFVEQKLMFRLRHYFMEDDVLTNSIKEWALPSCTDNESVAECIGLSHDCETFVTTVGPDALVFENDNNGGGVEDNSVTVLSPGIDDITSIAMTGDGCNIVAGAIDGMLVMWKKTDNEWESIEIGTHNERVTAVAISSCGLYVVSTSEDNTAVHWKYDGCAWSSSIFQYEKNYVLQDKDIVDGCALSDCGKFVVIGKTFGKVFVRTQEPSGWKEDVIHGSWYFGAFGISEDKNMIVCGSYQAVTIFERDGDEWTQNVLEGHPDKVTCVGIQAGKQQVVTGSRIDKTVRVWDVRAGEWEALEVDGHTNYVYRVAISAKRVVSGDGDGNVFVLDLVDGCWKKREFQVDGYINQVEMDESTRRLRVSLSYGKDDQYFIEKGKKWEKDTGNDTSSVDWIETPPLREEQWPLGLSGMRSDWRLVYAVPGGEWFAVCLQSRPYFDMLQMVKHH